MSEEVHDSGPLLPYGEQQGSFRGVVSCSNRDDGYFSGESNYVNSLIYTGFRYQCVEYARRFLLLTTGCVFGNCGRASEIYAMKHLTHVETGETYPLHHFNNDGTATSRPEPGDIIIYPFHPELAPWGHVGVISFVEGNRVGIAEQNHCFGSFISPDPDYLDGERCVARYAELQFKEDTKTWQIHELGSLPPSLGWIRCPGTPTRDQIFAPFNPLPSAIRDRGTPFDDPDHPRLLHYPIRDGFDIPSGRLRHLYGMKGGSAEYLVGATTATARVIRFTLQLLFHRSRLSSGFLALPANPLEASLPDAEQNPALGALFAALAKDDADETPGAAEGALLAAIASYFGLPIEWVYAMGRQFARGGMHMSAAVSFYPNLALTEDGAVMASPASQSAPSAANAAAKDTSAVEPEQSPTSAALVEELMLNNPHDESWCLAKVNFGSLRLMTEMSQLGTIAQQLRDAFEFVVPTVRSMWVYQYRMDFAGYLKVVEEACGPRTAFTVVVSDEAKLDGLLRELIVILQMLCERVKYPVRVIAEKDLSFTTDHKLIYTPSADSPPSSSPTTSDTPAGKYEVNFVFTFCEWVDILHDRENHNALYQAAVHPASDVVFAKPLWTYLCSGLVNNPSDDTTPAALSTKALSEAAAVRFFDICRRLYALASPRQPPESWSLEVSEFKDSCRRISIAAPSVPSHPPGGVTADAIMVNFANSCCMSHFGAVMKHDPFNSGKHDGEPAGLSYLFPRDA